MTDRGKIVIGLCTFCRVDQLKDALDSLSRIVLPGDTDVEFVMVDNNDDGFAINIFNAYKEDFIFPCHYFHERRHGLAYARNAVIDAAIELHATEIVMFDDDEIVPPEWLVELYKAYKSSCADGVSGTVYRLLSPDSSEMLKHIWGNHKDDEGSKLAMMSTNNCMFSSKIVDGRKMSVRFCHDFNFSGREDTAFSFDAQLGGATFSSAPNAIVLEKFPNSRCTVKYAIKRWFEVGMSDVAIAKRYKFGTFMRTAKEVFLIFARIVFFPLVFIYSPKKSVFSILRMIASSGWLCGIFGMRATYYKHDKD